MVGSIEEGLAGIDPAHADEYMRNGEVYREKLRDLDAKYSGDWQMLQRIR